jgi:EAL and modified HD-GYP domain-containing signal transduction protein
LEHFIARQPIFDRKLRVFGYELLFRSGLDNFFDQSDGDRATTRVIADSLFLFGMEAITGGAMAFINFTRQLLVDGYGPLLPRGRCVIEIVDRIKPDDKVIEACKELLRLGYTLAFPDYVLGDSYRALAGLAGIVEVDFKAADPDARRKIAAAVDGRTPLLAQKLETREDFEQARDLGYSYFQGYFFNRPVIVSRKDVPGFKLHHLRVLQELSRPEVDFDRLETLVKTEANLSYKLLRYINSASIGLRNKVNSIRQALILLGAIELRRWAALITLTDIGQDKPLELLVNSIVRARFCEKIASPANMPDRSSDLFLMGLFSLLDAIFGRPLAELLDDLPITDDIKEALLGGDNKLTWVYELVEAYEHGAWASAEAMAGRLGIDASRLPAIYMEAVNWSRGFFG